jgi:glycosyltransferase involved in cell wall biosynthesis
MIDKTPNDKLLRLEYEEIVSRLPTCSPIYLPTDKLSLAQKVQGLHLVQEIYDERLDAIYRPKLRALRARYRNTRRAFIIGNGPSLNRTDLSALRNEVTFAVNGFILKLPDLDWKPTFYVVEDHLVAEDRASLINSYEGSIKLFPTYLAYILNEGPDTVFFNHAPRKSFPNGFDFSLNASEITYTGCTVTNTTLQLAHYLGFEQIYLVGVDASYAIPADVVETREYGIGVLDMDSPDPNHFHPDYFGKGYRWHDPQVEQMLEAYAEAERVTSKTGRPIFNCTVGGKLEVFQRLDFYSVVADASQDRAPLPDSPTRQAALAAHPRLLVIDMTRCGDGTATGEVKKALLRDWPNEKFMQLFDAGADRMGISFSADGSTWSPDPVDAHEQTARLEAFDPEIILYRPLADRPALHREAMRLIRRRKSPVAIWIMDDWMDRLRLKDPARYAMMDADLRELVALSTARYAISKSMAAMLTDRYGGEWEIFSNAVDQADWPMPPARDDAEPFLIRYAGGLAEDMSLQSLCDVAETVDKLAQDMPIRLEISTRDYWYNRAAHHFEAFRAVSINSAKMAAAEYRSWLSAADAVLIAYNFDEATQTYVRYSTANKLPECLASGAVTLAYGPSGIETIDYLRSLGCAKVVTSQDPSALADAIKAIADLPHGERREPEAARKIAFDRHRLADHAERLRESLLKAAGGTTVRNNSDRSMPLAELPHRTDPVLGELQKLRADLFASWLAESGADDPRNRASKTMKRLSADTSAIVTHLARMSEDAIQAQQDLARDQRRMIELLGRQISAISDRLRSIEKSANLSDRMAPGEIVSQSPDSSPSPQLSANLRLSSQNWRPMRQKRL